MAEENANDELPSPASCPNFGGVEASSRCALVHAALLLSSWHWIVSRSSVLLSDIHASCGDVFTVPPSLSLEGGKGVTLLDGTFLQKHAYVYYPAETRGLVAWRLCALLLRNASRFLTYANIPRW